MTTTIGLNLKAFGDRRVCFYQAVRVQVPK